MSAIVPSPDGHIYDCYSCGGTGLVSAQEQECDWINYGVNEFVCCRECIGSGEDVHPSNCECDACFEFEDACNF